MKVYCATGTGNSLYLAKGLGGEIISIPQALLTGESACVDDAIGVVFPVYWLGIPKMVKRLLRQARWSAPYYFAIASYGLFAAGALAELRELGRRQGIRFDYLAQVRMPSNYLPMADMERERARWHELAVPERLGALVADIRARRTAVSGASPLARLVSAGRQRLGSRDKEGRLAWDYVLSDACSLCGVCASVCPVANIEVDEGLSFADRCEACFACLHACPSGALRHPRERSAARFRNPEVGLGEIVALNAAMGSRGEPSVSAGAGCRA